MPILYVRRNLVATLTAALLCSTASAAAAQDSVGFAAAALAPTTDNAARLGLRVPEFPPASLRSSAPAPRPAALTPLYASFAVMQALDMHSTMRALDRGGREANPLMGGVVKSPAGMAALKAGASLGIVMLSERLWKQNRAAAILTMVALNGAYGAVVTHNYSVASR